MRITESIGARSVRSQSISDWTWYFGGGTSSCTHALIVTIGTGSRPSAWPAERPSFEWTLLRIASIRRSARGSAWSLTAAIVCELSVIGFG